MFCGRMVMAWCMRDSCRQDIAATRVRRRFYAWRPVWTRPKGIQPSGTNCWPISCMWLEQAILSAFAPTRRINRCSSTLLLQWVSSRSPVKPSGVALNPIWRCIDETLRFSLGRAALPTTGTCDACIKRLRLSGCGWPRGQATEGAPPFHRKRTCQQSITFYM